MKMTHPSLQGAALAGLAVALGAFGAHSIRDAVEPDKLAIWVTGVRYLMWHALALMLVGVLQDRYGFGGRAALLMLLGSVLFSGSLFALTFGFLPGVMGPVTPLGGLCLLAGWVTLVVQLKHAKL